MPRTQSVESGSDRNRLRVDMKSTFDEMKAKKEGKSSKSPSNDIKSSNSNKGKHINYSMLNKTLTKKSKNASSVALNSFAV